MSTNNKNAWTTDIVLIDIINFSKLEAEQQLEIINFLTKSYTKVIEKMINKSNMSLNDLILGYISTGDGFYCILNPKLRGYGTILGLNFSYISELIAKKYSYFEGLKIAVHTGKVYQFIDILGHKNYIGDGLNDCARFVQIKGYTISTIMVSDTAYESLKTFLNKYKIFNTLLMEREFKYSSPYTFEDKHAKKKEGRLVWLRKAGIINPPNTNLNSILRR
ncbi:hypothetical protein [Sulfurimonas sp.]|uniref:hypothetical protein n=1 Tax=Sulfurimonas sp. TaxID=2022749 RepID=UPI0025DF5C76|nr:hypothetical protein [Sulfurimonas sp.]